VTSFALLPSPLLGAAVWDPVAGLLRDGGHRVAVASLGRVGTPAEVLAAYVEAAGEPGTVLVPHSNAGYFAPAVADRCTVAATVYVDAALPAGSGTTALAPPAFLDFLTGLADADGLLPPWTAWWDDTDGLFPDDITRATVEAGQPRLPLSYFRSTVGVPAGWERAPSGYLAFADTYAEEAARARSWGWPARRLDGGHLHLLHAPVATAEAVVQLADELL
jgi:hypothetical protein